MTSTRVNTKVLDRVFTKMGTAKVEKAIAAFDGHDFLADMGANSDWNSCFLAMAGYDSDSADELGEKDSGHVIELFDESARTAGRLRMRAEMWLLNNLTPAGKARLFRRRSLAGFSEATRRKAKQFRSRSKAQKRRHAEAARAAAKEAQVYSDAADALLAEITATAKAKRAARERAREAQEVTDHYAHLARHGT